MAVAADHLGAGDIWAEAEPLAGDRLHFGVCVGVGAHGTTDLAYGHHLLQPFEPLLVAFGFRQPAGQLEAKGDRFAVNCMGAADHHGVFMGARLLANCSGELV